MRSTIVVQLSTRKKRQRERRPPRIVQLLQMAEEWQGLLDRGEVRTRLELGRRVGLSGVHVGQILALLKLHPDIRAALATLPPGTSRRVISERKLRALTRLPHEVQLRALDWLLRKVG